MKKRELIKSCVRIIIAAALVLLPALLRNWASAEWISTSFKPVSRYASRALSTLSGLFPFSLAEFLLYLLILGILLYIIITIVNMIRKKRSAVWLLRCVSKIALTVCAMIFAFNILWGLNYYSLSLADELNMDVGRYSVEALRLTTASFVEELNAIAGEVPRDKEGVSDFGPFKELAAKASAGWDNLAKSTGTFRDVRVKKPKPVSPMAGEFMSQTGITGIYIPFTGEANVNAGIPDSSLPFTMMHELSHSAGVAPENEANFAAFLACRENPFPEFRYSGYLSAFVYSYNALYREDAKTASSLLYQLDERVLADLRYRSEYWKKYEGELRDVGTKVNNTYLMAMKQTDGVKSYGMVVDLLIADYVSRNGNPDAEVEPVY
jgi:hypothetical protein